MQDWLHLSNNLTTNIPKLFCLSLPLRLHCLKKIKIQVGWKECKTKFSLPLNHLLKATSLSYDVIFLAHIVWAVSSTLDFDYKMVLSSAVSFSWRLFLVVVVCMLLLCVCVKRTVFETLSMYFPLSLQYAISDVKVITRAE